MVRSRVKLAFIENASSRKITMRKRIMGLMKKMHELNILCDVEGCVIIFDPEIPEPQVWPSQTKTEQILERFHNLSQYHQTHKMSSKDTFMKEAIQKLEKQLKKVQVENRRKEVMHLMMSRLFRGEGSSSMDVEDRKDLALLANEMIEKINEKIANLEVKEASGKGTIILKENSSDQVNTMHEIKERDFLRCIEMSKVQSP